MGHKHKQRYSTEQFGVKLVAGAVNPSRYEKDWDPGYNIVKLRVDNEGKNQLTIETFQRKWQNSPPKFVAVETHDGADVFTHSIELQQKPCPTIAQADAAKEAPQKEAKTTSGDNMREIPISGRELIYNFWKLTASERRKVTQNLGLYEDGDDSLSRTPTVQAVISTSQRKRFD